eukprot:CAMPEP_0194025868 /NCGR_PEP_ID=MMETSP0009_2-20130614/152_1 /TAXON_ID=210454 /ORGANISM="Grammatophora oceanica, Strain CCMP 410" /LENGTH=148 /DNA_ID=CAMNT_0038664227 /DNA_START=42 /DNA_END=488 /DNA_ORIENTATION=-
MNYKLKKTNSPHYLPYRARETIKAKTQNHNCGGYKETTTVTRMAIAAVSGMITMLLPSADEESNASPTSQPYSIHVNGSALHAEWLQTVAFVPQQIPSAASAQSSGQLTQSSPGVQIPSPHAGESNVLQFVGHDTQSSSLLQMPSSMH